MKPSRTAQKKLPITPAVPAPDPIRRYREAELQFSQAGRPASFFRKRLSQFAGLSAVLAFVLVDLMSDTTAQQVALTDWKLVALFLPFLMIPIVLTLAHEAPSNLLQYAFIGAFVVGLALAGLVEGSERRASWFNQESLTLATIYIYFLSGLPFFRALFCGLSAWLAFGVSQLVGADPAIVLQGSAYLIVANAVGASGLYYLEWYARQKQDELERLRSASLIDDTTHVLNRRAIDAHLQRVWRHAWRESKSLCVLRLNTDDFHATCRQLGRDAGNAFLLYVAQTLSQHARRPLDAVGRYGNDEFLVIWYDVRNSWLIPMLQLLNSKVASFDAGTGIGLSPFTLSGAVAQVNPADDDEESVKQFMAKLNTQLRQAKKSGRGKIVIADLPELPQLREQAAVAG